MAQCQEGECVTVYSFPPRRGGITNSERAPELRSAAVVRSKSKGTRMAESKYPFGRGHADDLQGRLLGMEVEPGPDGPLLYITVYSKPKPVPGSKNATRARTNQLVLDANGIEQIQDFLGWCMQTTTKRNEEAEDASK